MFVERDCIIFFLGMFQVFWCFLILNSILFGVLLINLRPHLTKQKKLEIELIKIEISEDDPEDKLKKLLKILLLLGTVVSIFYFTWDFWVYYYSFFSFWINLGYLGKFIESSSNFVEINTLEKYFEYLEEAISYYRECPLEFITPNNKQMWEQIGDYLEFQEKNCISEYKILNDDHIKKLYLIYENKNHVLGKILASMKEISPEFGKDMKVF